MGGEPLYALAVAAFPNDPKLLPLLADVMMGAVDKSKEAGICIIGGHTVKDKEPKFGLSVTGGIHPDKVWNNRGAKAGDLIVLTKPIGTGVATTGIMGNHDEGYGERRYRVHVALNAGRRGARSGDPHRHRRNGVRSPRASPRSAGGERPQRRDTPF
jgi:selenophosphate synthase